MATRQSPSNEELRAPSLALLALEFRAPWEFGALLPAWPALMRAPAGDGHTVMVFPGLSASDASTIPLRRYIGSLGYETEGWSQGFNFGPRAGVLEAAKRGLAEAFERSGRKVSLIGWSLGGVYARELAKELPQYVRGVITLGSPFAGPPKSTNAWRIYELTSGRSIELESENYDLASAPLVPTTSIFSRSDGIVAWQGSIQQPSPQNPATENVEVIASHIGIGVNPSAWWAVADRLSLPESHWRPFDRTGLFGLKSFIYPDPNRT
ncbi:MAG: alpha/beta hydrolase [Ramlibacter sp.]